MRKGNLERINNQVYIHLVFQALTESTYYIAEIVPGTLEPDNTETEKIHPPLPISAELHFWWEKKKGREGERR